MSTVRTSSLSFAEMFEAKLGFLQPSIIKVGDLMPDSLTIKPIEKLFKQANLDQSQQVELMSFVCELFCNSVNNTSKDIKEAIEQAFPNLKDKINRETPRNLLRLAAHQGLLTYHPPFENRLALSLAEEFEMDKDAIRVVHSRSLRHVAQETAKRLVEQVRDFKRYGNLNTVHIGFAGGRLLRLVAENFAKLLREPNAANPDQIVFHAMVAAYGFDDFEADPNSFITYFLDNSLPIDFRFVPIMAPGIVETELRSDLRKFRAIDEGYKAADKLNIIVSSGGDWSDEHSTTQRFLKEVEQSDVQALNDYPAIGDLLWQPLSYDGPIDMDNGDFKFRPNILVDLKDLPDIIQNRNVRVLLALGPCGKCGKPKGNLLNTILSMKQRLVTDIVTNSPTAVEALKLQWQPSQPPPARAK